MHLFAHAKSQKEKVLSSCGRFSPNETATVNKAAEEK
jgi:hypothetical protein